MEESRVPGNTSSMLGMNKNVTLSHLSAFIQCIYIQNLSKAIGDEQVHRLIELLKKKMIWGVNIGESYEVSSAGWRYFCDHLKDTNVTHLYVSEHTIPIELKNEMRFHIRENRKKHDKHCAYKYLHVIERVTNMWW